jgi:hypothetical protein
MMKPQALFKTLILLFSFILSAFSSALVSALIPVAGEGSTLYLPVILNNANGVRSSDVPAQPARPQLPTSTAFAASVTNGQAEVVTGVYVPGVLALAVQQQPEDNSAYVTSELGVVTQFQTAASLGVIGLLAHNHLSGAQFFDLAIGQEVQIVNGDGSLRRYRVSDLARFQALDPYSPYSDFIDLSNGDPLSVGEVFSRVYTGEPHVTFQTCIENNGLSSWGRLFVIATPIN